VVCAFGLSCGSGDQKPEKDEWGTPGTPLTEEELESEEPPPLAHLLGVGAEQLYSFSPTTPGLAAYHQTARSMPGRRQPAVVAIDRNGSLGVLRLAPVYRVNTANAKCGDRLKHLSFHYRRYGFIDDAEVAERTVLHLEPALRPRHVVVPRPRRVEDGYFANTPAEFNGAATASCSCSSRTARSSARSTAATTARNIHKFDSPAVAAGVRSYAGKFYVHLEQRLWRFEDHNLRSAAQHRDGARRQHRFHRSALASRRWCRPSTQSAEVAGKIRRRWLPQSPNAPQPPPQPQPQGPTLHAR
jgi:hypothetical protein